MKWSSQRSKSSICFCSLSALDWTKITASDTPCKKKIMKIWFKNFFINYKLGTFKTIFENNCASMSRKRTCWDAAFTKCLLDVAVTAL